MSRSFKIGKKNIGSGYPAYLISEISANHLQNLDYALKLVEVSAKAGVDAIKIQTLTADTMTIDCNAPDFVVNDGSVWDGRKLYELYSETPLPYDWHQPIIELASKLGIDCFSTPYDITALDFLDQFDMPAYKVSSFEILDIPLIKAIARKGKPIIISTGIAELPDIQEAITTCLTEGNNQIALLKCTSAYPAPYKLMNLKTIPDLKEKFDVVVGLSDHTLGIEVPIASVVLGASIIEKHVTLDRSLGGPDSGFSLEPAELEQMVQSIKNVEAAYGKTTYNLNEQTKKYRLRFGRSLYFVKDIKKGEKITNDNIRSIRPGFGLSPKYMEKIVGKTVKENIKRGTATAWNLIND